VRESIPTLDQNWMGYAEMLDVEGYRTLEIEAGNVVAICEKGEGIAQTHKPYIGLTGIRDYQRFWEAMDKGRDEVIVTGECYGMRSLVSQGIKVYKFTWSDTGNLDALVRTREAYKEFDAPNILEKTNEAIWFVGGQVIKFSDDENFISNRVARAQELQGFVPEVTGSEPHMYRYPKVDGRVLSEVVTLPMFEQLLEYSKFFWKSHVLSSSEERDFCGTCIRFYRDKTKERVELFYERFGKQDGTEKINGLEVSTLNKLFNAINWDWLAAGQPGRFHGDFHFENILYSEATPYFTFLDWRQDFGGSLTIGDLYYDLAKLLHGLIVCHEIITRDLYKVEWNKDEIRFDLLRRHILVECEQFYMRWLAINGYDARRVKVIAALIYLNIAALHHYPYCLLLYALGKEMLKNNLEMT